MFRHPNAIFMWVTRPLSATPVLVPDWDAFRSRWPHRGNNSPHPPETQTKTVVAFKERVTQLKTAFGCRNISE
jgi:hypothetical protein